MRWSTTELVEMVGAVFQHVERQEDHHLGTNRYLTAYQLVLGLFELYPREVTRMIESGLPLGGEGTGQPSLSQWVARQLSQYVRDAENASVEGAFLSSAYLTSMVFMAANQQIQASPNDEYSLFRRCIVDQQ